MASKQIPACHERRKSHIRCFSTGYRAKDPFNLGERAYLYFYYFTLIIFVSKRLMLTPTANLASQHLQFHSSLGCVQPCGVYRHLLSRISHGQAISTAGPKLMPHCQDHCVPDSVSTGLELVPSASHDSLASLLCEDGNELCREGTMICGLTAVI